MKTIKITPKLLDEYSTILNEVDRKIYDLGIVLRQKNLASEDRSDRIIGKGYKDTEIINESVKRSYTTEAIIEIINKNKNIKVYTTWGNGSKLKEWRGETAKLGGVIKLKSPSLAARVPKGSIKFDYMLDDWSEKINY